MAATPDIGNDKVMGSLTGEKTAEPSLWVPSQESKDNHAQ
jgi:hypothetical protein